MAIVSNGQYFTVKTDLETQKGAVLVEGGQGTTVVSYLLRVVLKATLWDSWLWGAQCENCCRHVILT